MSTLVVMAWSRTAANARGPLPRVSVQATMTARLAQRLATDGLQPVSVVCESWRAPAGVMAPHADDFLCRMRLRAEPGPMKRSFASWLQWRHPRWHWSDAPFPASLAVEASVTQEAMP